MRKRIRTRSRRSASGTPPLHKPMSRALVCSLIALSLSACTGGTVFHRYKPLPPEGWDRRDTMQFDLPKAERDIDGTLFVGLRTTANLRYRDVVLAVEQRLTSPLFYRCDTVRYLLTDDEGFALSPGVNHHQYESQHVPFHLQKGQSGSVRIRHLMRHEVIPDITELGIRIDE